MKQAFVFACCVGWGISATQAQEAVKHQLPKNPKDAVVTLDYRGGFTPPRIGNAPSLSILADGSVEIPANFQGQQAYSGKLTADELQVLLRFIIDENKFFEYDAQAVQRKLRARGPGPIIADASTTTLTVHANGQSKTVQLPQGDARIEELQRIGAIRSRLERLRAVIQLGGKDEVERWLKVANQHLKQQQPNAPPLTADHFQSGSQRAPGSYFIQFQRMVPAANNNEADQELTMVNINQQPGAEPRVSVVFRPGKQ